MDFIMDVLPVDFTSQADVEDCVVLDSVSASVCLGGCVHEIGCIITTKVQIVWLF